MEHPSIRLAAVNVVDLDDLKEIAAYVVLTDPTKTLEPESLRSLLRSRLPEYMMPRYLDVLERPADHGERKS